jgi:hypothetical protein
MNSVWLVAVPQREGEHAAKALHAVFAPGFPGVHDALGVALGVEDVAQRLQFGDQFLVVVDLAVEDHDHRAVFVEQRLLAGGDVDDGQAPVAEAQAGLDVQAAFVRAAVRLRRRSCGAARVETARLPRVSNRCR